MKCRFCSTILKYIFVDLGNAPLSNSFLTKEQLNEPETYYPLKLFVCDNCFLVQIDEYKKSDEIFSNEYIYYSSFSRTWLSHAEDYSCMICKRFGLNEKSFIVEIASNDGYLLQYFNERNIPCLGIEPAKKVSEVAKKKGIEVINDFFGTNLAEKLSRQSKRADLLIGNNVLAHVPNINDFVSGLKIALKTYGIITLEFPHLMCLIENNQFDTIYHEHFSYFSFFTVNKIFAKHGLTIFDVETLPSHGGSLRIYAKHTEDSTKPISFSVQNILDIEKSNGMLQIKYYQDFQYRVDHVKYGLLTFLIEQKKKGKKVAGYGAAAKGNTLLNYCGIKKDLIKFVVDASPYKNGKFLPGSKIPVVNESEIILNKPDFILILPWNIKKEIINQLGYIKRWDGKFVLPIPEIKIIS